MNPYSAPDAQLSVSVLSNETYEPRIFAWNGRIGRLRYIAYSWGMITVLMFVMGTFISIAVTAMMKGRSQPRAAASKLLSFQ